MMDVSGVNNEKIDRLSVDNARLTLLDELKLKLSRSKNPISPKLEDNNNTNNTNHEQDRSIGSSFTVNQPSYINLNVMDVLTSIISNTSTGISDLDTDVDVEEKDRSVMFFNDEETSDQLNKKKEIKNDEVWLMKTKPTLNALWEQLMDERKEHHKTAYTLESLQNMYYSELQRNAILQNTIDKFRFSEGSHSMPKNPQNLIEGASKIPELSNITEDQTSITAFDDAILNDVKAMDEELITQISNETGSDLGHLFSNVQLPSHTTTTTSSSPLELFPLLKKKHRKLLPKNSQHESEENVNQLKIKSLTDHLSMWKKTYSTKSYLISRNANVI
ncbi:hypothetical protein CHUAL_006066 [Chamberlinius hualienensis]